MAPKRTAQSAPGHSPATRQGITTLGPDLLGAIFYKLGPSPMHVAVIACVCKDWRNVMQESTWKLLCLDAAPALCKQMGYDDPSSPPLGGWLAAYKVITYCAGLVPSDYENLKDFTKGSEPWPGAFYTNTWWDLVGHVEEKTSGFQTGPAVMRDLRLRKPFRDDVVFVTSPCAHEYPDSAGHEPCTFAFRGVVQDFAASAIAAKSGAEAYLEASSKEQELMQQGADDCCAYCQAPLFKLLEDVFFENNYIYNHPYYPSSDDSDDSEVDESAFGPRGFRVEGSVCGNGHLMMGGYGSRSQESFLEVMALEGSGEDLQIEKSDLMNLLCETFFLKVENDRAELAFRRSIDPFSASAKLTWLAVYLGPNALAVGPGDENDTCCLRKIGEKTQELAKSLQKCEVLVELDLVKKRISTLIERFEVGTVSGLETTSESEYSSESDPELEAEMEACDDPAPFWALIPEVLDRVERLPEISLPLVRLFLGFCTHSPSYTLNRIEALESLDKRRSLLQKKAVGVRKERRGEIEAALKAAGVSARYGRRRNQWPDYRAVYHFIRTRELSVQEVIECQRR
ncbi:hypothetical protein KFL_000910260 [Klebsormidium nitens]|uniref:F-box domain-containing protein n=1 Tax=Klebsormidium nitens TaxID=105231 RepID=A0A1Y1HZ44_KLENI|nr:hypothetical protein KFL_000910260 [Klebsormidium nitens]|eukprot:GAQ81807.1 hypothetical protein KFL_000910260 [Klebsormidium nitens]